MKIVLATHSFMAEGMKKAIELLLGERDNLFTINAYTDEQSLEEQFQELFKNINKEEQVLVFTDLYGGSVNQFICSQLSNFKIELVAGANLSVVLEIAARNQETYEEAEIQAIITEAKQQFRYVNQEMKNQGNTEEFDFFEEV